MPEFKNGSPNPERRVLGGIYVRDRIEREITINLAALRNLNGVSDEETQQIRHYLLALTLIAATADIDLFLRSGCQLQIPQAEDEWSIVPRRGVAETIRLSFDSVSNTLLSYAENAVKPFKSRWPDVLLHKFDIQEAKKLLAKKQEDETDEG